MVETDPDDTQIEFIDSPPPLRRMDDPSHIPAVFNPVVSLNDLLCTGSARVAYIASKFPAPSETFVYREVRELRRHHWQVTTISLHDADQATPDLDDLWYDRQTVYGSGWKSTLKGFVSELINQFPRTLRTLWRAGKDAIAPGEKLGIKTRLRLLPQAVAAIGLSRNLALEGVSHIHCHFAHAPTTIGMYAAMQAGCAV